MRLTDAVRKQIFSITEVFLLYDHFKFASASTLLSLSFSDEPFRLNSLKASIALVLNDRVETPL